MFLNFGTFLKRGRYKTLSVLGQGGFGITYLVEENETKQRFAIKEFYPKHYCQRDYTTNCVIIDNNSNLQLIDKLQNRFISEAENLRSLNHDGIVALHDIFYEYNTVYFVMDFIEGESLSEIVKRQGKLDIPRALRYLNQVGEALEYMHSRRMTHFDIKPGNIMIRRADDKPMLIDFGLSIQYNANGEQPDINMGAASKGFSANEMYSPEQLKRFSPESDVFSLGATLYYLLTGITPPETNDVLYDGLRCPAGMPDAIASAIREATGPRTARTQSVREFLGNLNQVSHSELASDGDDIMMVDLTPIEVSPCPMDEAPVQQRENVAAEEDMSDDEPLLREEDRPTFTKSASKKKKAKKKEAKEKKGAIKSQPPIFENQENNAGSEDNGGMKLKADYKAKENRDEDEFFEYPGSQPVSYGNNYSGEEDYSGTEEPKQKYKTGLLVAIAVGLVIIIGSLSLIFSSPKKADAKEEHSIIGAEEFITDTVSEAPVAPLDAVATKPAMKSEPSAKEKSDEGSKPNESISKSTGKKDYESGKSHKTTDNQNSSSDRSNGKANAEEAKEKANEVIKEGKEKAKNTIDDALKKIR